METDITRAQAASEAYDRAYEHGARDALLHGFALIREGELVYKLKVEDGFFMATAPTEEGE